MHQIFKYIKLCTEYIIMYDAILSIIRQNKLEIITYMTIFFDVADI